uniref:Vascular endothelial growth factor A n=1 Tax=Bitis gabonica TaxID=8694 RepID=VEGFA_BITGA|nr:RecName: Full=Vascular endothelial growth factor A; Short=VEGF-A; AltName: Full=Vascular permeability factor; Short=VPF; Flags: Precursor [Bitis gabonica]AAR06855.1 vascular endothelial growth factor [Bitis gabonica]
MNFLLTWIHWGLAALLYFHNAKVLQAAPAQGDGERQQGEVIPFLKVYERSICRPVETMVDIFQEYPDEVEYIFKPSCVALMRCGGCCNDEALECVPTEMYNVTMEVMKLKPFQSQHIHPVSFQQHSKCECRPKKDIRNKDNHCEPCSERRKHLYKQDPLTCKCSCKAPDLRCKSKQLELNERTCRCERPRR